MCFEEVSKVEIEVGKQAGVTVSFLTESLPSLTLSDTVVESTVGYRSLIVFIYYPFQQKI